MQIEFEIDQQRLTRTSDAYLIEGSKNFVECIFSFSSDWAELDKWALFKRDNNTYEIYIEDNKCLVPIQCTSAEGEFTISVVGRKNAENVTGTASDKLLTVRGSEFVGGMGEEGRLTETYLVEVLGEVKDLREKAATSEANAAESAQNAKGYADKAKEYSESVNVYIPSVSQDGVMTWTNKAGLANPTPVNVKGERGEKGEQGAKGDTGTPATVRIGTVETGAAGTSASVANSGTASAAVFDFIIPKGDKGATGDRGPQGLQGAQGLRGEKGEKGDQGTGVTIKGKYDSLSALMAAHPTGKNGDAYMVGVNLYAWSGTEWIDCGNIQGPKGERGEQGPQGLQGAKGDKGEKGEKGEQGAKGDTGTPATIKVGTVKTGAAGTSVTVSNSGTASAAVFDFVIPRGDKGDTGPQGLQGIQGATGATGPQGERGPQGLQGERGLQGLQGPKGNDGAAGAAGAAATIKVGVVTTGAAGTAAKVTNSGTTSAAVLDFVIPQGPKGDKGEQGAGSIVAVDSELSSTSTNPVQNKVVKAAIDTVKKNMSQGFQTVTDSIPTKVSALENDAKYLTQHQSLDGYTKTSVENTWTAQQTINFLSVYHEKYPIYIVTGTNDTPIISAMMYKATNNFTLDLGALAMKVDKSQISVFSAYFTADADYALTITNCGTVKYIGSASDVAITSSGLLLNIMMVKDASNNLTSIVQANKLS